MNYDDELWMLFSETWCSFSKLMQSMLYGDVQSTILTPEH